MIILVAKFAEGAWITVVVVPCVMLLLHAVHRYYRGLARELRAAAPLAVADDRPTTVLVVIEDWSRLASKALGFAMRLSQEVVAVHLVDLAGPNGDAQRRELESRWSELVEVPARRAGLPPPRLLCVQSEYRHMHAPILELARALEAGARRPAVAILIPELVKQRWWQFLLHTQRARRLRAQLLRHGGARTVVVNVPWRLEPLGDRAGPA